MYLFHCVQYIYFMNPLTGLLHMLDIYTKMRSQVKLTCGDAVLLGNCYHLLFMYWQRLHASVSDQAFIAYQHRAGI